MDRMNGQTTDPLGGVMRPPPSPPPLPPRRPNPAAARTPAAARSPAAAKPRRLPRARLIALAVGASLLPCSVLPALVRPPPPKARPGSLV